VYSGSWIITDRPGFNIVRTHESMTPRIRIDRNAKHDTENTALTVDLEPHVTPSLTESER